MNQDILIGVNLRELVEWMVIFMCAQYYHQHHHNFDCIHIRDTTFNGWVMRGTFCCESMLHDKKMEGKKIPDYCLENEWFEYLFIFSLNGTKYIKLVR